MENFVSFKEKYDIEKPLPGGTYKFLAIRHAESLWNKYDREQKALGKKGVRQLERDKFEPLTLSKDPSISKVGFDQTQELAKKLIPLIGDLEVILVSPMQRAMQTLQFALEYLVSTKVIERKTFAKKVTIKLCPLVLPKMTGVVDFPFRFPEVKSIFHEEYKVDYSEVDQLYERHG